MEGLSRLYAHTGYLAVIFKKVHTYRREEKQIDTLRFEPSTVQCVHVHVHVVQFICTVRVHVHVHVVQFICTIHDNLRWKERKKERQTPEAMK